MTGRILVIKLAALGDFVQAFEPFAAIRAHHPRAEITLLTTPPYAELAGRSPWFDRIWTDGRPGWGDLPGLWRLWRRLRGAGFARVYDLQTSARSSRYRWMVGDGVEWSGIARGASHPHANPLRDLMHTIERQREQLEMAGIREFPPPDLSWLDADVSTLGLPPRFALLVPGASPQRPGKRWPAAHYAALAAGLDLPVAVVGGPAEAPLAAGILAAAPGGVDLTGRTGYAALGAVARRAAFAVGNDTGPTHLIAAAGCPTLVLFGPESDPALCAPRGRAVAVLQRESLARLAVAEARAALAGLVTA
ncbi:glycosyltransferase family 9 protein [Roseicella aquatilis]|uniref:Lipopolysaccharide heptosyltransferase family protein n=1 Tax=Roseicella aquatilis TaxID=2527868 RepID=A0A4R4DHM0_9PROT|nr:glycosyltransferase family 9 protein [Roseicella aquatilis]TCZ59852.1 lipopolysaccharide heptosyltransferase family protein [Roseicella aquatilis]